RRDQECLYMNRFLCVCVLAPKPFPALEGSGSRCRRGSRATAAPATIAAQQIWLAGVTPSPILQSPSSLALACEKPSLKALANKPPVAGERIRVGPQTKPYRGEGSYPNLRRGAFASATCPPTVRILRIDVSLVGS